MFGFWISFSLWHLNLATMGNIDDVLELVIYLYVVRDCLLTDGLIIVFRALFVVSPSFFLIYIYR